MREQEFVDGFEEGQDKGLFLAAGGEAFALGAEDLAFFRSFGVVVAEVHLVQQDRHQLGCLVQQDREFLSFDELGGEKGGTDAGQSQMTIVQAAEDLIPPADAEGQAAIPPEIEVEVTGGLDVSLQELAEAFHLFGVGMGIAEKDLD